MQDFIVWYKNKDTNKVFSREFNLNQLILQNHLDEIFDSPGCVDYEILSILPSTGKVDSNENKIYADSSIFEFNVIINGYRKESYTRTIRGYFKFYALNLEYEIHLLENLKEPIGNLCSVAKYDCTEMSNFKIIDTIQENKLKLI